MSTSDLPRLFSTCTDTWVRRINLKTSIANYRVHLFANKNKDLRRVQSSLFRAIRRCEMTDTYIPSAYYDLLGRLTTMNFDDSKPTFSDSFTMAECLNKLKVARTLTDIDHVVFCGPTAKDAEELKIYRRHIRAAIDRINTNVMRGYNKLTAIKKS